MRKVLILFILLIAVPAIACDPGNSPSAAAPDSPSVSSDAPSAAPAAAPSASPSAAQGVSPGAAQGASQGVSADLGGTDGGVGVDRKELAIEIQRDCKWIIWNHCVNPVQGEDYSWLVDGEKWYKVTKHKE